MNVSAMAKFFVKTLLSVALVAYIASKVDFDAVSRHIERADIPLLSMALFLALCSTTLAAYRWGRITGILNLANGWRFWLFSYFKGSFFNQALPGSIGGDAVRVLDLHTSGKGWAQCLYAVFIDRIAGLAGLLAINLIALAFMPNFLPAPIALSIAFVCLSGLSGLFVLAAVRKIAFLEKFAFLSRLLELSRAFRSVYHDKREMFLQVALSVLVHLFSVLCIFSLARAVRLEYDVWLYCLLMPPVFLAMIAPISLAGWGVREGAMVALFAYAGADKAAILAVSMLYGLVVVVSSLPGALVWLSERRKIL